MGFWANIFGKKPKKINKLGELFNEYHTEFSNKTCETSRDLDIDAGLIRFLLFGSDERKNAAWKEEHGGGPIYFSCVSSRPVEIWGDVREVAKGKHKGALVINPLSLGHEVEHMLRIVVARWTLKNEDDGELLSPDKYTEI